MSNDIKLHSFDEEPKEGTTFVVFDKNFVDYWGGVYKDREIEVPDFCLADSDFFKNWDEFSEWIKSCNNNHINYLGWLYKHEYIKLLKKGLGYETT